MPIIMQGLNATSLVTQGYATSRAVAIAVATVYARTRTLTVQAIARARTVLAVKRS